MIRARQSCRIILAVCICGTLVVGPVHSVDPPGTAEIDIHEPVARVEKDVSDRIAERIERADRLDVPDDIGDSEAAVYIESEDSWEIVEANRQFRFIDRVGGIEIRKADEERANEVTAAALYADGATLEFSPQGVYVVEHAEPEPLLDDPREAHGYTEPPSESQLDLLPESEDSWSLGSSESAAAGAGIGAMVGVLLANGVEGRDAEIEDMMLHPLAWLGITIASGVGGWFLFGGYERTERDLTDNIQENEQRRRELEREQEQVESENQQRLEEANEEIREENRQLNYVKVQDLRSGEADYFWLSD